MKAVPLLMSALMLCAGAAPAGRDLPRYRWFYLSTNLLVDENVPRARALIERANHAGYNGCLLSDYKFNILDRMPQGYFDNVLTVSAAAREHGIELVPAVCPIGYSNGLLAHDPDLAEGLPVKDALYVVKGAWARLKADPAVRLKNGGFETAQNHLFPGWDFQDFPGQASFADRKVRHGGDQSLRFTGIDAADPKWGHGRIMQTVKVAPWRQYHFSVWVRTREFAVPGNVKCTVLAPGRERALTYNEWAVKRTQTWTRHHAIFNSQEHGEVRIYLGTWGGKGGTVWFDSARLQEAGMLNIIRREGCPLTVRGENGKLYREGHDFAEVKDEKLGVVPWPGEYSLHHQAPMLRLVNGTRIKRRERLRVSFYHAAQIHHGQVVCCLSDPKVYRVLGDQVRRVNDLLKPRSFFMSHDEIRVANWCQTCRKRGLSPGEMLADNVTRCAAMIRKESPGATIFVWSDMFDPFHNARDEYYLVNGTWEGSWKGLDRDVILANWFFEQRRKNMPWFAERGHRQILAGYYDSDPKRIRDWLEDARGIKGVIGAMYTTWRGDYSNLEAFAHAAWGKTD